MVINVTDQNGTLSYVPQPTVVNHRKKHKVKSGDPVQWVCDDGDLAVVFPGGQSPFQSGDTILTAVKGSTTSDEVAANLGTFEYIVIVSQPGQAPPFAVEDPDLEVSDVID